MSSGLRATWRLATLGFGLFAAATPALAADRATSQPAAASRPQPNLFGTVTLPTSGGLWAAKWQRVAADRSVPTALIEMIRPLAGQPGLQQLRMVQAAVDRRIQWRSDGTLYGERDHWATARETLAQGYGDDEDRAILKYQALRALGWKPQDLFLVMGRDAVRGPYTLLAARSAGRFWLLEDRGGSLVPAEARTGFTPMVSFGEGGSWLHGKLRQAAAAGRTVAATALTAVRR